MRQLTVRGFDQDLESALRESAEREGISLSQAALRMMRKGAGLEQSRGRRRGIGARLDCFIGTMTAEEEQQILGALGSLSQVDEDFWL